MSRANNNRNFIKSTGQQIIKMPRSQTGTDESGNPVYEYLAENETTIYAITEQGEGSDRLQRSPGASEKEIRTILVSDQEDVGPNTHFRTGGFEYAVRQRKPAKVGMQRLQLERKIQ